MKKQSFPLSLILIVLFALLLIFPSVSFQGVKSGLVLWGLTLVPVLFPFFLLTGLMRIYFPVSDTAPFYLILGFLSGYPVGASLLADSRNPHIRSDFYLGLISNPSPAFLITFVGEKALALGEKRFLFYLMILLSYLLGNVIANFFLQPVYPVKEQEKINNPDNIHGEMIEEVLWHSIEILLKIGGYIMFFSIIAHFLLLIPIKSSFFYIILPGFCELTTGISLISNSSVSTAQKIVPAAFLSSFGGLCSVLQIKSVLGSSGLSVINYIIRKLLSSGIAVILTLIFF